MSDAKTAIAALVMFAVVVSTALVLRSTLDIPLYPQATGIFPQVISCANQTPDPPTSAPNWQPPLRVTVEPVRDPGRIREYRVFGCTLYYYHAHFR